MQLALHKHLNINISDNVFIPHSLSWIFLYRAVETDIVHSDSLMHYYRSAWGRCIMCPWNPRSLPPGGNSELYLHLQDFCSEMSLKYYPFRGVLGFWIWSCPGQNVFSHLKEVVEDILTRLVLDVIDCGKYKCMMTELGLNKNTLGCSCCCGSSVKSNQR